MINVAKQYISIFSPVGLARPRPSGGKVASAGLAAPVEVGRTSSALLVEVHRPLAVLLEVRRCSGLVRRKDLEGVADLAASLVPRRIDSAAASAVQSDSDTG